MPQFIPELGLVSRDLRKLAHQGTLARIVNIGDTARIEKIAEGFREAATTEKDWEEASKLRLDAGRKAGELYEQLPKEKSGPKIRVQTEHELLTRPSVRKEYGHQPWQESV